MVIRLFFGYEIIPLESSSGIIVDRSICKDYGVQVVGW